MYNIDKTGGNAEEDIANVCIKQLLKHMNRIIIILLFIFSFSFGQNTEFFSDSKTLIKPRNTK